MSAPLGFDRASIDALGWTLLHFVWQGVLIAMAFAGIDRLLSRASANLRYLVACGTLLVMLLVPIGTFVVLRDVGATATPILVTAVETPAGTVAKPHVANLSTPERNVTPGPERVTRAPRSASTLESVRTTFAGWVESARVAALFPWVVMLWGMGVLALSIRLLGGWWLVRRIRNSLANAALPDWEPRLQALSQRIGVSRPVRLFRSAMVQVPTAIGWLHPVILL